MNNSYELLDSGNMQKLEQVGRWRLIRPALNAFWQPTLPAAEWAKADAIYTRDNSGSGKWSDKTKLPESWNVEYHGFMLKIKRTNFGHLGFFAEQFQNWEFYKNCHAKNALNLFAYSGVASMAMAAGGAQVVHLDASKGMNEWGQENREMNSNVPNKIRWIADDVTRFVAREIRRGNHYDLIALDPPTFGRGSSGQVWKIEESLPKLLKMCAELRDTTRDFNLVLSCHSPGFSPFILERLLREVFGDATFHSAEMTIPEKSGQVLPAGVTTTCHVAK